MKQSGFSLFVVLIIMIVIAFMVVVTMQYNAMEQRSSANEADKQTAMANAQNGVNQAEDEIRILLGSTDTKKEIVFNEECKGGYCSANGSLSGINPIQANVSFNIKCSSIDDKKRCQHLKDVWKRTDVFTNDKDHDPSKTIGDMAAGTFARYVVEYLGSRSDDQGPRYLFRITTKGWGQNGNTSTMVQTVEEAVFVNQ